MDILCWALFAVAVDLLLGFTGLLSFGHAAFWGTSAYATGLVAIAHRAAVPGGGRSAARWPRRLLAVPIGYLSVRRTGIYFAMVTLAFAQMVYFVANQWRVGDRRRERPAGRPARLLRRRPVRPVLLLLRGAADRAARPACSPGGSCDSPFGRVLVAIRDNPARARALGYPVDRYKLLASCCRPGWPGSPAGCSRSRTASSSLQERVLDHVGQGVMMVVLGGIGTLWGGVDRRGAGGASWRTSWRTAGFDGIGLVTGTVFVVVVLLFRRGIWGTARDLVARASTARRRRRG